MNGDSTADIDALGERRRLSGKAAVDATTALLQRGRSMHPWIGLYDPGEVEWWWTRPRHTDGLDQLFWFDEQGPIAAAHFTDFGTGESEVYDAILFCPFTLPGADEDTIRHVATAGVALAEEHGFAQIDLEVSQADPLLRSVLDELGFTTDGVPVIEQGWIDTAARPPVPAIADGYRLTNRAEVRRTQPDRPHHMTIRTPVFDETRLRSLSQYDAELDLVVLDANDDVAAYGLFWFDPVTSTGVVEPMRTFDDHQRRGLARHVLTAGIDLLARAGAARVAIGWEPDNAASGALYQDVGFVKNTTTDQWFSPQL